MSKHTENIQNEARRLFASWRYDGQPVAYSSERMNELLSKTERELWTLFREDGYDGLVVAADAVGYMVYYLAKGVRAVKDDPPRLFVSEGVSGYLVGARM